jgi:putative NADH-flavin reductase
MNLVVLGARGGIGLEIVREAIEHSHSVTAFERSRLQAVACAPLETLGGLHLDSAT